MYNAFGGLTKTHVDSVFDKISEIGKQQTKEKCLGYITSTDNFFLSPVSTEISSLQVKDEEKSLYLPQKALCVLGEEHLYCPREKRKYAWPFLSFFS